MIACRCNTAYLHPWLEGHERLQCELLFVQAMNQPCTSSFIRSQHVLEPFIIAHPMSGMIFITTILFLFIEFIYIIVFAELVPKMAIQLQRT